MTDTADITILGAGPTGSALALLLARTAPDPARIVLCHAWRGSRPAPEADTRTPPGAAGHDPRAIALNHGSRVLLDSVGAWPARGAAIHTVHVSQRGRLGRTLIRDTDFGVSELGTVHQYDSVQHALHAALVHSGVTLREGPGAVVASQDETHAVIAQGSDTWRTRLVVQAEGGGFDKDPADFLQRDYDQHAVLAVVRAARPAPGWAWERFTREGPLALLPVHAGDIDVERNDLYSLVWCCSPARATSLQNASDAAFAQELNAMFGERMGTLSAAGPRHTFPLRMQWRREIVATRRVIIGNAAQTLHPVAGQGLNLGLRDAARLAQLLAPWQQASDESPDALLQDFARARRGDRTVTAGITDILPRIFSSGWAPVEHACGLALLGLDTVPLLRRPLARQLMHGLRT